MISRRSLLTTAVCGLAALPARATVVGADLLP